MSSPCVSARFLVLRTAWPRGVFVECRSYTRILNLHFRVAMFSPGLHGTCVQALFGACACLHHSADLQVIFASTGPKDCLDHNLWLKCEWELKSRVRLRPRMSAGIVVVAASSAAATAYSYCFFFYSDYHAVTPVPGWGPAELAPPAWRPTTSRTFRNHR